MHWSLIYFSSADFGKVLIMKTASVVWWSEFLATDPVVEVRFPALPDLPAAAFSVFNAAAATFPSK
jgi:hypothetical protein